MAITPQKRTPEELEKLRKERLLMEQREKARIAGDPLPTATESTIPVQIEPAKQAQDTIKPQQPTGAGITPTPTPTSTTTVLTPTQRAQKLAEEFGAGSEAVRLAGLDTPEAQFEEMIKEQKRQKKVGEELTAFEKKKQEAQLKEFKKQAERTISGVQTQLAQGPEGVITTTAPLLSEEFKQTQNKRIQLQIDQVRATRARIDELTRQAERERSLGRAEAAAGIIKQRDLLAAKELTMLQNIEKENQASQDRAFTIIDNLRSTGDLAGMSDEEIQRDVMPLLTALPQGLADSMIRNAITSAAQAGEATKLESQQALLKNFTALAKEGIALPMSTMQQFAEQSGLPLETFMSFNDRAQQIFADKSLSQQEKLFEIGLLEGELDRDARGVLTTEAKNLDLFLKMKASGQFNAQELADLQRGLGIESTSDPEFIAKQLDNQLKALQIQFDAETNPLKKQKLGLEIEKGKIAVKEQRLALQEAGFGQYGDVTDKGSYVEGKSPRLTAGGAAQGVGSAANKLEYNPSKFLTNIDFGDGSRGTVVNIGGQEMKIVQAFGSTASGEPGKHGAIDFRTKDRHDEEGKGGTIPAFTNGEIVKTGVSPSSYGGYAWIRDDKGQIWQYGHLNVDEVNALEVGQTVSEGENFIHAERRREKWGVGSNEHLDFRMVGEQEAAPPVSEIIDTQLNLIKQGKLTSEQAQKNIPKGAENEFYKKLANLPQDTSLKFKNATQAQDYTYAERMRDADILFNELDSKFQEMNVFEFATGSGLPNWAPGKGEDFKKFEQAKRNFVNAVLRRESGAAIAPSEFENAEKQYFFQAGDTPAVTEQKRKNREVVINGMLRNAGQKEFAKEADISIEDNNLIDQGISFLNSPEQTQITPDVESDIDSIYGF